MGAPKETMILLRHLSLSLPAPYTQRRETKAIQSDRLDEVSPGCYVSRVAANAGLRALREIHQTTDGTVEMCLTFEASETQTQVAPGQTIDLDLPYSSYVIAPGALYNGNRFLVSPQPYCPFLPTEGVSPDGPILVADVPRLCSDTGYHTELAGNALTTPFLGLFDPKSGRGAIISFEVYGDWGVTGLAITTLPGEPIRVSITYPVMREKRYRFCDWGKGDEPGITLKPGTSIKTKIAITAVQEVGIPAFIATLNQRAWAQRGQTERSRKYRWAVVAEQVEAKQDEQNWDENIGCYLSQLKRETLTAGGGWPLQTGWVGGGVAAIALLQSPNPER